MFTPHWDLWSDKAKREALAVALILTTTFGGWSSQYASAGAASRPEPVTAIEKTDPPKDPVESIFAFRDKLERVQLQLGFEPVSRNPIELTAACKDVVASAAVFLAALDKIDDAVAGHLRDAAGPTISVCDAPLSASAQHESAALDGFSKFWEASFDVAA